ncbi:MAG: deoxyribodipyrimidine photo-lyase, partial [Actinomycetes bacterium]
MPTRSVLWLRRDLRLHDHPALVEAATTRDEVLPLFVIDPALWTTAGAARREYLRHSLAALNTLMDNNLVLRAGNPVDVVPGVAREVGASAVHISADFGPYGST